MQVGAYEILPVMDGEGRFQPMAAYAGTTEADWAPHRNLLDADGMLPLAIGGFLIRGGPEERLVLVDVGIGPRQLGSLGGGKFIESLAVYGLRPRDITDVVFTHLHFDHTGWASADGAAVFDHATYRCDPRDWEYWITDPPKNAEGELRPTTVLQKELLDAVADRVQPWSSDGPVLPGLDVLHAPGHTPGSTILVVSDGTARALLLGDVVHCPVELLESEWGGLGDVDPALAKRTKNALARELEGTDTPISAAHFPGMQFGRLLSAEGRRRWVV
ncbi:MAG: MBL fold metallo-hydrolase [Dehalococcoidia bacterium]